MVIENGNDKLISFVNSLVNNICEVIYVDIDKDVAEFLKVSDLSVIALKDSNKSFLENIVVFANNSDFHPDDIAEFRKVFDRENLSKIFINKEAYVSFSFRKKVNFEYKRFVAEIIPSEQFSVDNRSVYIYVKDLSCSIANKDKASSQKLNITETICSTNVAKDILNVGTWCIRYDNSGNAQSVAFDDHFCEILGIDRNDDIPDSEAKWMEYVHSLDRDKILKKIVDVIKEKENGKIIDAEVRVLSKFGEYHWCRCSGEFFSTGDGYKVFIGILVDISKRREYTKVLENMIESNKQLEKQLKDEHEKNILIESLGKIYYRIFDIDLINDKIRQVALREDVGGSIKEADNVQLVLNNLCEEMVIPEYRAEVKQFCNISSIYSRIAETNIISIEYQCYKLGWCRSQFIVSSTDKNGKPTALLFVCREIGKEKEENDKEADIIRALSSEYQSVYVGDFETAEIRSYRMSEQITNQFGNSLSIGNYDTNIQFYVQNAVLEEDRNSFDNIITIDKLRQMFSEKERFRFNYRVIRNGEISFYLCQGIHVAKDSTEFILGFKNIDESIKQDISQREMLREALQKAENALESERKERGILISIANVYHTMHMFNLKDRTLNVLSSLDSISEFEYEGIDEKKDIQEIIHEVMIFVAEEEYLQLMNEFTDFTTLNERLKYKDVISQEFIGKLNGWTRASFIVVEKNEISGELIEVLFVTQIINDEKQREEQLIKMSNTDELTGLANRRAYESDIEKKEKSVLNDGFTIVSLDLNGLKVTNDTYGHSAGDDLLIGAAECLTEAFSEFGMVYRTGGDEFAAIVECDFLEIGNALAKLSRITSEWKKGFINELSISCGCASHIEFPDFSVSELEKKADQRMYKNKEAYYSTHKKR